MENRELGGAVVILDEVVQVEEEYKSSFGAATCEGEGEGQIMS